LLRIRRILSQQIVQSIDLRTKGRKFAIAVRIANA